MHSPTPDSAEPEPHSDYLDRLMRRQNFAALWPLFAKAEKPAKELTESFSALVHLQPYFPRSGAFRVIHVGDGAHARTGALFALRTQAENISVDPCVNVPLVTAWRDEHQIARYAWRKACVEEVAEELNALPQMPVLVSFVHAHVDIDRVLSLLRWDVAYTLACCVPGHQLTRAHAPHADGLDLGVLSPDRHYQVLVNTPIGEMAVG